MNGITELHLYYVIISTIGIAFVFTCLIGPILRIFKRFIP